MSKMPISERILGFGFRLSIAPINYLVNIGIFGRVLCFVALIFYTMPVLIVFNVIGFTFFIFKK